MRLVGHSKGALKKSMSYWSSCADLGSERSFASLCLKFSIADFAAIPTTAPMEITSVVGLSKPEVATQFRKRIQGINPAAGISRFSHQMIIDYGLADLGFHFENGTVEDCTGAALDAVAK